MRLGKPCAMTVAALGLATLAARAADVQLGPPPGWYKPTRITLKDAPAETLSAQPKYMGTPLYGALRLGDGEDDAYSVVADIAADWKAFTKAYDDANGAVAMRDVPARIYVDANNDEDLTDDGDGLVARCIQDRRTPGSFVIVADKVVCQIAYADGAAVGYPITFYMFPQRAKRELREGGELDYARTLFCYRDASFEAKLTVADRQLMARFYDENTNALIKADDDDILGIDINEDGKINTDLKGPEVYALTQPFNFKGESYVLDRIALRGAGSTVVVSEEKVSPPVYIAVGEPAPDFTMQTLDGKTFKLSEHRGHIVLLDFWATWCPPCRAEMPNVVEMWNALKDRGLTLVGVSLDYSRGGKKATDTVTKFASENRMTWTHIVEGKGWDSEVGQLYQISSIPATVLVGRDGKIIAIGLRGTELRDAVEKALGE